MKEKVCLTTFIYGEKYQEYIPLLVYSCMKSHPEYSLVLFVYGKLSLAVKDALSYLDCHSLKIVENAFSDYNNITPLKARSLRWVLWDDSFNEHDYLYIVDIDMIYINEGIPLHTQHIIHMDKTKLCFDNLRRNNDRLENAFLRLLQRVKYAGLHSIFWYLFNNSVEYKLSGLHFIKISEYYKVFKVEIRDEYTKKILSYRFLNEIKTPNDEVLLYHIVKKLGLNPDVLSIQSDPVKMLGFNNPDRDEFRPHHGIHLGLFRSKGPINNEVLDSKTYLYYASEFKRNYLSDPLFIDMLKRLPEEIQTQIERVKKYYCL